MLGYVKWLHVKQCFGFQDQITYFWDTVILYFFLNIRINNFRGNLISVSACNKITDIKLPYAESVGTIHDIMLVLSKPHIGTAPVARALLNPVQALKFLHQCWPTCVRNSAAGGGGEPTLATNCHPWQHPGQVCLFPWMCNIFSLNSSHNYSLT